MDPFVIAVAVGALTTLAGLLTAVYYRGLGLKLAEGSLRNLEREAKLDAAHRRTISDLNTRLRSKDHSINALEDDIRDRRRQYQKLLEQKAVGMEVHLHDTSSLQQTVLDYPAHVHDLTATVKASIKVTPIELDRLSARTLYSPKHEVMETKVKQLAEAIAGQLMSRATWFT